MKRLLFLSILFVNALSAFSQDYKFYEDFDSIPYGGNVISSNTGAGQWGISTTLFAGGQHSDSCVVPVNDTVYLTSTAFSTLGYTALYLEFRHICKIEVFDIAEIEVSNNNGASWSKLGISQYMGNSYFGAQGEKFAATSYADWIPGTDAAIPTNAWWKNEKFNVSALLGNVAQAKIRFVLRDGNNNGAASNYGWLIDDINVWVPSAQEASLMSFSFPYALPSGCGLENETIRVKLFNSGGSTINGNLSANFQISGQTPVSEMVPGTLLTGDSMEYTFTNKMNLSTTVDTVYSVKFWLNLTGDPNQTNDTISAQIQSKVPLPSPILTNVTIPFGTSTTLTASHPDTISWYSDILATNKLGQGSTFTTPVLFDTTTYYVQAAIPSSQSFYVGPASTSIGTISSSTLTNHFVIFDVLEANGIEIETFDMYPTAAVGGAYTIVVQNSSQSVIASYSGNTTVTGGAKEVVTVNLTIPAGTGYRLGFSTNPGFNRNTTGAVYPYTIPGVLSITGNTFNTVYAYYFYNWKVSTAGGVTGCPSKVTPLIVGISGTPQYNAGVKAINSPVGTMNAGVSNPVNITLKNFAIDTLKKVEIHYSVNGVLRTPYLWTGNLAYNDTTQVSIGNETFSNGIFNITSWTSMPNDSLDGYTGNDTASALALVCFSGTFTIGGIGADFEEITDAVAAINLVGVCGPTVFEINPGVYDAQLVIDPVSGASAANTLTFTSSTNDSTSVEITSASAATIKLNGASYITIKNLTVSSTVTTATSAIELSGGAHYNIISNCILTTPVSSTTTSRVVNSATGNDTYTTISNNKIIGGYTGIYLYGTSNSSYESGNIVKNNDVSGFYLYGMYLYYQDSIQITDNKVYGNDNTYGHGIYTSYLINGYRITGNSIHLTATAATACQGIRDYYGNYYSYVASPTGYGLIANNMISIEGGTGAHNALYSYYCNGTEYYYNSVLVTGTSSTARALHQANTASNTLGTIYKNNIWANTGGGYSAYFTTPAQVAASDYNNFYTTGATLAYWSAARTNLAALQGASGKDANSKSVNPNFLSNADLHIISLSLNNAGTPITVVTHDIDGDLRNALTPDIGADEIDLLTLDAGITLFNGATAPCPGSSESILVTIRNFGLDTLITAVVNWSLNGVPQTPYGFSGSLPINGTAIINIGNITFLANTPYSFKFWTSLPNGQSDLNSANDTLFINNKFSALPAGTYTIGPDVSDNWTTFNGAVSSLLNGICGPVVINVKNGTYTETVDIPEISGTSAINTITFKSLSGDSTAVLLSSAGTTLKLNGTDYVTMKGISISTSASSAAYAVEFLNGAHFNTLTNCVLTAPSSSTSTSRVVNSTAGNDNYNTIAYNKITGGYYAIYFYGTGSSSYEVGNIINQNEVSGFYLYGIYPYYQDSIQITDNKVFGNTNTYGHGIYTSYLINGYRITGNTIVLTATAATACQGIRDYYGNYYSYVTNPTGYGVVANNMISILGGTGAHNALYSYYCNGTEYYHNSVLVTGTSTTARALHQANTASNTLGTTYKNNVFANTGGGYAAYYTTPAQVAGSDYNNYYTTGSTLAYWSAARANLAALQLASAKDSNSISNDPKFISNSNLHLIISPLNDKGTPISIVPIDIDGEPRAATTPDIGADEFSPPTQDVTLVTVVSPAGAACGLTATNIEVMLTNTGTDPIQGGLTLYYSTDNGLTSVSENVSTVMVSEDTIIHTFAVPANLSVTQDSVFNLVVWANLVNDIHAFNDTVRLQFQNKVVPALPILTSTTTNYSTSANITASSPNTVLWYISGNSVTPVHAGLSYNTPPLFTNTWFWAVAQSSNGCLSAKDSTQVVLTNVPAGDLGISAIFVNSGCGLTANETITIDIFNQGTGTISSGITAAFRIDNGAWITAENVNNPIASGDTIQFTFATTANLFTSSDTYFTIKAAVVLAADPYQGNDTMQSVVSALYTPADPMVTSPVNIPYGTSTLLQVSSSDSILWYTNPFDTVPIAGGPYQTPLLFDTTTFYVQAALIEATNPAILALAPAGGNICNPTGGGNMFDVTTAGSGILINGFQLRFNVLGIKPIRIYYREGSFLGAETDSSLWIYHDSATVVTTAAGQLATFSIKPLALAAGKTYGLYAMYDANYASGANTFQNNDLTVTTGAGLCGSFSGINFPRSVSGELYYSLAELGCASNKIPIVVQPGSPPPVDAGMFSIVNPTPTVVSGLSIPVMVKIKNFGTDTLHSANISFEVDGILQSAYAWTGQLLPGAISADIAITSFSFSGGQHNIRFWVSNANGTNQGINGNDTLTASIDACLTGVFTLGSPSSDFPTFTSAISALNAAGVCGDVTFKVEPGVYTQQITFYPTVGAGPNSRIIFESSTGDSTDVVIEFNAPGATSNWTVRFDGADYYTLRAMTIRAKNPDFATAIELINGAHFNCVENNIIQSTGIVATNRGIYDYNTLNHFNTYRNNVITGGYTGIYVYGISTSVYEKGTLISGNDISGFYYYGIYSYYQDSIQIVNNKIHSNASTTGYIYGIYTYYNFNGFTIAGNNVSISPGSYGYGIRCYYNNYYSYYNSAMAAGNVFNNMISVTSGTYAYGLYAYYSNNVSYNFNSVNITGGSTNSYGLYQYNTASNSLGQSFRNNIFVNRAGSYSAYFGTVGNVTLCDYNNYFATASNLAYYGSAVTSLAQLQSVSGKNANSKNVDLLFFSATNLHATNIAINDAGTPITGITTDIDGELRDPLTPDMGADEFTPVAADAGAVAVISPSSPVTAGVQSVSVNIQNFGLDTLVNAVINWSVNNLLQAAYNWSGSIATLQTAYGINIGNFSFAAGPSTIKVWTSMPNGVSDGGNFNDTVSLLVVGCSAPMSGTYTIGGVGADFASFSEASLSLNYCGVNSPVVFNVNSGVYHEKIVLVNIPGASELNTVTFQSATGDSTDVVLTWGQPTGTFFSTLSLDGSRWITFKGITITSSATGGSYVVYLTNEARRNNFLNCVIAGPQLSSSTTRTLVVSGGGTNDYNTFKNNVIKGGYYAAYIYGNSAALAKGNYFEGNSISDFYYYGFYAYYQDSIIFRSNYITENSLGSAYYPAAFGYCDNFLEVSGNTMELKPATYTYGLRIYYCDATSGQLGRIFNNNISITSGTGTSYGMYVYYSTFQNIGFNNVNLTAGGSSSRAMYMYYGGNNRLANNNFVTTVPAYTIYHGGSPLVFSNHNNYYTTSSQFAYYTSALANLAAWQAASGLDQNSLSVDPGYYSPTDLHIVNVALNNTGIPFDNVLVDIDGETRSATTPDIGSDEFNPVPLDLDMMAVAQPQLSNAPVGTVQPVEGSVRNLGTDTIISFTINYRYGTNAVVSQAWTGSLLPGAMVNVLFNNPYVSAVGQNTLKMYVDAIGSNHDNDTITKIFTGVPVVNVAYSTNFDQAPYYWYTDGNTNLWQHGVPAGTKINAAKSSPNVWATNLNGQYSGGMNKEYLYSPYFNFSNAQAATLKFWHWREIAGSVDGCNLQYSTNDGQSWSNLGYKTDPLGTNWYTENFSGVHAWAGSSAGWVESTFDLSVFDNMSTPVQFRFSFFSDASNADDGFAIDNFSITLPAVANDAGVTAFTQPAAGVIIGSSQTVEVVIRNFGTATQTSIPVAYKVNNQTPVTSIWTGSLAPDSSTTFQFSTPFTVPGADFALCAYTSLAGDPYSQNDETCVTVNVLAAPFDAGVMEIVNPTDTVWINLPQDSVTIRIVNFGTNDISNFPVQYTLNGMNTVTEVYTATIPSGDTVLFTFAGKLQSPMGMYSLCAKTNLATDVNPSNDQSCVPLIGLVNGIDENLASGFGLFQNTPNPAAGVTEISYILPNAGTVVFEIRNIFGQALIQQSMHANAGVNTISEDVSLMAAGVYYYSLTFNGECLTRKMVVRK